MVNNRFLVVFDSTVELVLENNKKKKIIIRIKMEQSLNLKNFMTCGIFSDEPSNGSNSS
jgi:hypothetical protein